MCIFMLSDIYINDETPQEDHADAIGVFYNNQCIGWEYYNNNLVIIPTIGNDGDNPQYPSTGDSISFHLYDDSQDLILNLQTANDIPLWTLNQWPTLSYLYACSYNLEINEQGECPSSCVYDPNIDGSIDLLDIISLINMILNCSNCDLECGNIVEDSEINIQDILTILEIILDD